MHSGNLSHFMLMKYLNSLTSSKLINRNGDGKYYTTELGRKFISEYYNLARLMDK